LDLLLGHSLGEERVFKVTNKLLNFLWTLLEDWGFIFKSLPLWPNLCSGENWGSFLVHVAFGGLDLGARAHGLPTWTVESVAIVLLLRLRVELSGIRKTLLVQLEKGIYEVCERIKRHIAFLAWVYRLLLGTELKSWGKARLLFGGLHARFLFKVLSWFCFVKRLYLVSVHLQTWTPSAACQRSVCWYILFHGDWIQRTRHRGRV